MDDLSLIQFIKGRMTHEDAIKVLNWIEESDANKEHFVQIQTLWAATEISTDHPNDPKAINQIIQKTQSKHKALYTLYKYIAAACVITAIATSLYNLYNTKPEAPDYEAAIRNISQTNEITLKISNKKEIRLSDSIPIVSHNNKRIIINDSDSIEVVEESAEILNTVHVPFGKRLKLILADGSTVHLNSGSTLVYPSKFNKKKREVYLDGEAFFEISPKDNHLFIVQTLYRAIEVYGTKFNVSVDRELQLFETTLVSGSVAVKGENTEEKLMPNQCYSYSDNTQKEEIKEVDVDNYILWTEDKLKFTKEVLYIAIRKLEKIYNIQIKLADDKYLNYHVSGLLNLKDDAEETVRNLMLTIHNKKTNEHQHFYQITHK